MGHPCFKKRSNRLDYIENLKTKHLCVIATEFKMMMNKKEFTIYGERLQQKRPTLLKFKVLQ